LVIRCKAVCIDLSRKFVYARLKRGNFHHHRLFLTWADNCFTLAYQSIIKIEAGENLG